MTSLGEIGEQAGAYPTEHLVGCEDALILFAAGFLGRNDGYWIAEAGLTATCVDIDDVQLRRMRDLYPPGWRFVCGDVFVECNLSLEMFDVVSADPPSNLAARCLEELPLLLSCARRLAVIGCTQDACDSLGVSNLAEFEARDWRLVGVVWRSANFGGTYWLTLRRS